jgi:hypothetical protein
MQCYFTDAILLIFYVVIKLNINELPQKKLNINKILICEVRLYDLIWAIYGLFDLQNISTDITVHDITTQDKV